MFRKNAAIVKNCRDNFATKKTFSDKKKSIKNIMIYL